MGRELKAKVLQILTQKDFKTAIESLQKLPVRGIMNPLFSFFYNRDERIKWHAVSAMGIIVAQLAQSDRESARVILRRLMWSLNDESGGIGWGAPEAMGDILTRSRRMAQEYHRILLSYINPDGNYIEHEKLQRGVLWGIGRLAHSRQDLAFPACEFIDPYAQSGDPFLRGLSAWLLTAFESLPPETENLLDRLRKDPEEMEIYIGYNLVKCTIKDVACFNVGDSP